MQAVLLFGLETWVITLRMCQALEGFQHRVSIRITGIHPQRLLVGIWEYPPLEMVMQEAVFKNVEEYVLRMKNALLCDATDFVPLRGDGADVGDVVCENVVGAEETGPGRISGVGGGIRRGDLGGRDRVRSGVSSRSLKHGTT